MRALAPCVVALAGCSLPPIESAWDQRARLGLTQWSASEHLRIDCPRTALTVQLALRGDASAGALRICLRDPAGTVRHDATLTSGSYAGKLSWAPVPGTWTCELQGDAFTGGYGIELSASSLAAPVPPPGTAPAGRQG